jgi:hypothetical protein
MDVGQADGVPDEQVSVPVEIGLYTNSRRVRNQPYEYYISEEQDSILAIHDVKFDHGR